MRKTSKPGVSPSITIRVSGSLFATHLSYLDQLVDSATECLLWPLLDLARLKEFDVDAVRYLARSEGGRFGLVNCPQFLRDWMRKENSERAA